MRNAYLNDLLEQPTALAATLDNLLSLAPIDEITRRLQSAKYRRIVLTGMGSSYHGLYPLQLRLFELPLGVVRLETAELIHHARELVEPTSLIIAVSQSGQSAEIVQLLNLAQEGIDLIGVTNTPGSPLADRASLPILTRAGEEASVSCKTYISALAALTWLGDQLLGEAMEFQTLAGVPEKIAEFWVNWEDAVEELSQKLIHTPHLFLVGRGNSLASAKTGALIIKEAARYAAEGMNSASFRHGPFELISPQTFVLVFLGLGETSTLNSRLTQDVLARGGLTGQVGMGECLPPFLLPASPAAALPILEIQAAQMLSLALANNQGIEAGQFIHAHKITSIE